MASFREHVGFSSLLGLGYGTGAYFLGDFTPTQAILAGYLAGIGGMLPDLDSSSGRPVKEIFSLVAAVAPLVFLRRLMRLTHLRPDTETIILLLLMMYILLRYGLAWLVNRFSTHRGMFHSLPAMGIAAELVYLTYPSDLTTVKLLMGAAVAVGFFSHLLLDEVYAIQWAGLIPKFKKSFGTALKMTGKSFGANAFTYALLMTMTFIMFQDAGLIGPPIPAETPLAEDATPTEPVSEEAAESSQSTPLNDVARGTWPREASRPQEDLTDAPLFR